MELTVWEQFTKERPRAMVFGLQNKELVGSSPGIAAKMMDDNWEKKASEFWWSKVAESEE